MRIIDYVREVKLPVEAGVGSRVRRRRIARRSFLARNVPPGNNSIMIARGRVVRDIDFERFPSAIMMNRSTHPGSFKHPTRMRSRLFASSAALLTFRRALLTFSAQARPRVQRLNDSDGTLLI